MASGCVTVHNYIVIKFVGYVRKIQMGFRARFLWLVSYSLGFESYISDHHRTSHKDPEGKWRYSSTPLTSALDVSWWSTTHPDRFTRRKETWYPLHRRTGGPQSSLDGCGKFRPHQDLISGPSSPQPVAIPTALPGLHIIQYYYLIPQYSQTKGAAMRLITSHYVYGGGPLVSEMS